MFTAKAVIPLSQVAVVFIAFLIMLFQVAALSRLF